MEFILAALSLGFLGSFHCVGMCGPIAMALPLGSSGSLYRMLGAVTYNSGRIITYGLLGLLFGLVGKGFVIGGYQQALSIVLGLAILLTLLFPSVLTSSAGLTKIISAPVSKLKSLLRGLFARESFSALFLIGVLNGFLPCGLVYIGVAGAIATGDAIKGSLFMMAFGAGTIPALLAVSMAGNLITVQWRAKMRKAVPVFIGIMAVVLILRGLNLGIPYVSPELSKTDCTKHTCCKHKN